jgi:predicted nucleic acid-binding protein
LIVVDASTLTDFLLGRRRALDIVTQALEGVEHEPLHAPELIEPETLNALRRLVASGAVSDDRASRAASDLGEMRLIRHAHAPLRSRVWALRDQLTAYDATYLALAEAIDARALLTSDAGLAERAAASLGDGRVHLTV